MLNHTILIGNVATEPQLDHPRTDTARCTFRIAVDRPNNPSEADFFDITCWERQAHTVHEHVGLGRLVVVEGRLRYTTWDNDAGHHSRVEVVAHRVRFLTKPKTQANASHSTAT